MFTTLHLKTQWQKIIPIFLRTPGGHDPRHSLVESLSVYRWPSNRQRSARRRHVQEQEGQRATHLEMQGEAQKGRNSGHRGFAGAESELDHVRVNARKKIHAWNADVGCGI